MSTEQEKKKSSGACPYAASLLVGKSGDGEGGNSIVELAKQKCPAFRGSADGSVSCPFKDAGNAEDIRKTMMTVPKSHLHLVEEEDGRSVASTVPSEVDELDGAAMSSSSGYQFRMALEHMHMVSKSLTDNNNNNNTGNDSALSPFALNGECPFHAYYHHDNETNAKDDGKFTQAMERFSVSSVMAKMARSDSLDSADSDSDHSTSIHLEPENPIKIQHHHKNTIALSTALKKGTQKSHKAAENVHFVRNFIKGKINRDLYAKMIFNLYFVYVELERLLDEHAPAHFPTLHKPHELHRTTSLEQDVEFFVGTRDWRTVLRPSPATVDYVQRMRQVAHNDPLLLLAHAYTRYLGDLSGGRVLQRVARKALQLPTATPAEPLDGLRFYDFEHIANAKAFKNDYREALDAMHHLTPAQIRTLVGEANVAFVLNMRLFEELDVLSGDVDGATVRPLHEALAFFDTVSLEEETGGAAECPFLQKKKKNTSPRQQAVLPLPAHATTTSTTMSEEKQEDRCPWPFVFLHDPAQGMRDYQTWVVLALITCSVYNMILSRYE